MTDVFSYLAGDTPLLVSVPHDGRELAPGMAQRMTGEGLSLPDTDWHVRRLYGFCKSLGASVISANYSRYVVDLNRPASDDALYPGQLSTGLCPVKTFAGQPIYTDGMQPDGDERIERTSKYWRPYHDRVSQALDELRVQHGYALLWDAHSIAAEVPALFEGQLPDLNVGTDEDRSCGERLQAAVVNVARSSSYSCVDNGRFKGGYITRNYGSPERRIHAVQLELSQRCYLDGYTGDWRDDKADAVATVIEKMIQAFLAAAEKHAR